MKEAKDWAWDEFHGLPFEIDSIKRIQANALRWAANLSGDLHRATVLDKADELDPPEPKKNL